MEIINTKKETLLEEMAILIFSPLLIAMLLAFVDERNYNFNRMRDFGNWVRLLMYSAGILAGQLFLNQIVLVKYVGTGEMILSIIIGGLIGIFFVIGFIYLVF